MAKLFTDGAEAQAPSMLAAKALSINERWMRADINVSFNRVGKAVFKSLQIGCGLATQTQCLRDACNMHALKPCAVQLVVC